MSVRIARREARDGNGDGSKERRVRAGEREERKHNFQRRRDRKEASSPRRPVVENCDHKACDPEPALSGLERLRREQQRQQEQRLRQIPQPPRHDCRR